MATRILADLGPRRDLKIRFQDLRHTCITKLAESLTSGPIIVALAEDVSRKMLAHYFHIRREARRGTWDAIAQAPSPIEIPADVHKNGAGALALRGTASASRWVCLVGLG
jgi:hypothetical protein